MSIRATRTRNQKPHVCSDMWYDIVSILSLLGYTIQSYSNFGKGRACPSQKGSSARSSKRRPNNLVIRGVSRSSGDRGNDHNGTTRTTESGDLALTRPSSASSWTRWRFFRPWEVARFTRSAPSPEALAACHQNPQWVVALKEITSEMVQEAFGHQFYHSPKPGV